MNLNNINILGTSFKIYEQNNTMDHFAVTFELYRIAKINSDIYEVEQNVDIPKKLIELYYKEVKPDYNSIIYNFKRKYIKNESSIEHNDSPEEKMGLELVYNYIQDFKPGNDYFNIFTTGLIIHNLLYKPLDDKRRMSGNDSYNFGGQLRTQEVRLKNVELVVPSAEEAKRFYNSFLNKEKLIEYENYLASADIFSYINYCIKVTTQIIEMQPFNDGNKRTARSLLNLMFKIRNLPPVYITLPEIKEYKKALFKAIINGEYNSLNHFYYYKICDSIYELDVKPYLEQDNYSKRLK